MKQVFNTIAELREYVPRISFTDYNSVKEYVAAAAVNYVIPAIGPEKYDQLCGQTDPDAAGEQLRRTIAYYAAFGCIQAGAITVNGQGAQQYTTDTSRTANYADKMDALNYYAQGADEALDRLIGLSGIQEGRDSELFVSRAEEIERYAVSIARSHKTLAALKPWIRNVQELKIRQAIGTELYDALLKMSQGKATDLSKVAALQDKAADQRQALAEQMLCSIKGAVANLAVSRALPMLTIRLTEGAVTVATFYSPAPADRQALAESIDQLQQGLEAQGETYFNRLLDYLKRPDGTDYISNDKDNKHYTADIF